MIFCSILNLPVIYACSLCWTRSCRSVVRRVCCSGVSLLVGPKELLKSNSAQGCFGHSAAWMQPSPPNCLGKSIPTDYYTTWEMGRSLPLSLIASKKYFPPSLCGVLVFDSVSRSRSSSRSSAPSIFQHTSLSHHHLSHTSLSHTIFHTHTHTHTHTHLFVTHVTPSLTHNFVTHHLSHTPSFTHTHTTLSHTHTPSFTHNFVTHHLSHTTLSHTIFHTQLCHTHTDHLSHTHTTLSHTIFHTHTHIFVTHHLSPRKTLSHTPSFTHTHTQLCDTHTTLSTPTFFFF